MATTASRSSARTRRSAKMTTSAPRKRFKACSTTRFGAWKRRPEKRKPISCRSSFPSNRNQTKPPAQAAFLFLAYAPCAITMRQTNQDQTICVEGWFNLTDDRTGDGQQHSRRKFLVG